MFKKVKNLFSRKQQKVEPDRVKNEISFTDLNKTEVVISVKHVDKVDLLFIRIKDAEDFIVLDQESALVLQAVMADFSKGGSIKTIAKLIEER